MLDLLDLAVVSSCTEESGLAAALKTQDRKRSLVYFYSSHCRLCQTIAPAVEQERDACSDWLNVAPVCTDNQAKWAPEMINYEVESVPCFVLLNHKGEAIAKSGKPLNKAHVATTLQALLRIAKSE